VGVVNLLVLACVLRKRSKKVVTFFEVEKCTLRENPGYAYVTRAETVHFKNMVTIKH